MKIDFYHLQSSPVAAVLPRIAERVLAGGGRLLVVSADPAQRALIDRALWTYAPDSFLPHAETGAGDDAAQPVLIAAEPAPVNRADHVALIDGQWRDAALGFARAFHLFDDAAIDAARAAWRSLAATPDAERRFWRQDGDGRWVQAA
ncbi:DNA polymerase III subunit chi [Sphingomonas changnyeongensis]|uniref:DNA polymerase III subunit chi n=1 Tax=Sphingomonas changnyeongensis TaxID=2698679 RepID=A0A7Z2NX89_9SPHN|nr:DNA polymerase III subunit chi [Sphingomonas changnyeongensis]QHL91503.1 DNA polymerase III subunit chi [Sphingomonas changnyeongensis]